MRTAVFTTGNSEFAILADPDSSGRGSLGVYGFGQDTGVLGEAASGSSFGIGVVGNGAGNGPSARALSGSPGGARRAEGPGSGGSTPAGKSHG